MELEWVSTWPNNPDIKDLESTDKQFNIMHNSLNGGYTSMYPYILSRMKGRDEVIVERFKSLQRAKNVAQEIHDDRSK